MDVFLEEFVFPFLGILIGIFSIWYTTHVADRFGLKGKIFEKKLNVTLELLEAIKSYSFSIHAEKKIERLGIMTRISFSKNMKQFLEENEAILDVRVYFFFDEYMEMFKAINQLKGSPYLDKSIADSLKFLDTVFYGGEMDTLTEFVLIYRDYTRKGHISNPIECGTLREFITSMQNVLFVIEKWIESETELKNQIRI